MKGRKHIDQTDLVSNELIGIYQLTYQQQKHLWHHQILLVKGQFPRAERAHTLSYCLLFILKLIKKLEI